MPSVAEIIAAKIPTGTALDTAGILARWPQRLREQALFSARMTLTGYLDRLRAVLTQVADGRMDEAAARVSLRARLDELGVFDDGTASILNPASEQRLNLILRTNRQSAASMAQIAMSEIPGHNLRYPAWRLRSSGWRRVHRKDWPARWKAAGESVGWVGAHRLRMVALKDSPIWQALGNGAGGYRDTLGNPYPPFAFGSSYGWREVSFAEARQLGLIDRGAVANSKNECQAQNPDTCQFHHPEMKRILNGYRGRCSGRASRKLLSEGFEVRGSDGRKTRFDRFARDHYDRGLRRRNNVPKPENLELLPMAVYTVRHGEARLKFARGTTPDYLNPPKGTQVVYTMRFGKETMHVYVYWDTGRVSGWHAAKK